MAHLSRKETEKRLRKMALAAVDMNQGIYEWPSGISPTLPDGTGRRSNRELLRVGDYSPSTHGAGKNLFSDPYFKTQYAAELARREARLPMVLVCEPTELHRLGAEMVTELLIRLHHSPESFSNAQLLQFGPSILEAGIKLSQAADPKLPRPSHEDPKMTQFNAFIAESITMMNGDEREDLKASSKVGKDSRQSYIDTVIDAAQSREEAARGDIIDAEVSAE